MDSLWLNAFLSGVLEGVTEFLPISSTGHLILVRDFLPLDVGGSPEARKSFEDLFDIVIQFPAILAIVVLYWKRLWSQAGGVATDSGARRFWFGLFIAFLPAAAVGAVFHHWIEDHLFSPAVVAGALFTGGLVILAVERWLPSRGVETAEAVPLKTSLSIGLFQVLSMIPGTSRSAATIIGARLSGVSRPAAAEYSFFLALPTMTAACGYKLLTSASALATAGALAPLLIGAVTSFVTAYLVVGLFMRYLRTRTLALFGYYRIALALLIFATMK